MSLCDPLPLCGCHLWLASSYGEYGKGNRIFTIRCTVQKAVTYILPRDFLFPALLMKQVILLRKSMGKTEQHGGAEDGLWLTASEKLKPLVLELQGNDICQHLPLVEPLIGTQSWLASWMNPCETLKHKTQLSHELLTHRNCGVINVSCFIWLIAGDCPWRVKSWELLGVMQSLRHVPKLPVPPPWRIYYP